MRESDHYATRPPCHLNSGSNTLRGSSLPRIKTDMRHPRLLAAFIVTLGTCAALLAADSPATIPPTKADIPYAGTPEFRQTLNVYAPATKPAKPLRSSSGSTAAAGKGRKDQRPAEAEVLQ
jgi:hypothetical protein